MQLYLMNQDKNLNPSANKSKFMPSTHGATKGDARIVNSLLIGLMVVGGILFLYQSLVAIYTLRSPMDEGSFILKGLAFVRGQYIPYQPYGFWVNKMPLSFLIPGWVLHFFDPGITAARYFALFVSLLFLIGTFLLIRRETNLYLAVAAEWIFALHPIIIKTFATATSQGLAACLLVWSLYFFFGKNRKSWQITIGSILTAMLILTRENLLPVLLFLWIYVFVRYRKSFWLALAASLIPLIFFHILYFPEIMKNWITWIPSQTIREAISGWIGVDTLNDHSAMSTDQLIFSRIVSFLEGIRTYLVIFVGSTLGFLAINRKNKVKRRFEILSLMTLFMFLVGLHAWASIGKSYCIYCFQNYLSFFIVIGVLILALAFEETRWRNLQHPAWVFLLLLGGILLTLPLSSYKDFYTSSVFKWIHEHFWNLPIVRIRDFRILEGTSTLQSMVINKFHLDIEQALKVIIPAFTLFALMLIVLLVAAIIFWLIQRQTGRNSPAACWNRAILVLFVATFLLLPTMFGGNATFAYQCQNNVINSINQAGLTLREIIPPGSSVDWRGTETSILLMYPQNLIIYPPEINNYYSYSDNVDSDILLKNGKWNAELSRKWFENSDFLIMDSRSTLKPDDVQLDDYYNQVGEAIPLYECNNETFWIKVFRKKP